MKRVFLLLMVLVAACGGPSYSELQLAAARGQTDQVAVMLDRGAEIDQPNRHGKTPLMMAADNGFAETVTLLAKRGASLNIRDVDGMTALMLAAAKGHSAVITALLEAGADVNALNNYDSAAITNSVFFGHLEATKALLAGKEHLDKEQLEKAVLVAAGLGHTAILEALLDYGVDVNARGKQGRTPLMAAVVFEHPKAVELLLARKADLSIRDEDGNTALDLAQGGANTEIRSALEKATKKK